MSFTFETVHAEGPPLCIGCRNHAAELRWQELRPDLARRQELIDEIELDQRRIELILMLGGHCVECGEGEPLFLEFDHINPEDKLFSIGSGAGNWERVLAEVKKCQLLCLLCHKVKTLSNRDQWRGKQRKKRALEAEREAARA
jgi:hypothetical protein